LLAIRKTTGFKSSGFSYVSVIPRGIEAYSFSLPFGYIFPLVKSRAKAFRFPRKEALASLLLDHEQK